MTVPRPAGSILDRAAEIRRSYLPRVQQAPAAGRKERVKEIPKLLFRSAGVMAGAGIFGIAQGRYGGTKLGGIPMDLAAGVVGHAIGVYVGGDIAPMLHNLADGGLGSFANTWGRGFGREWRKRSEAKKKPQQKMVAAGSMGAMPLVEATGGSALSDEELNRLHDRL